MRTDKILRNIRISTVIFLRLVKSLLSGTSSKISLEMTSSYPVMFKKAILVLEFKSIGLLYLESKPGYKSIDLNRMYLDLNSIQENEIIITGYGYKNIVRISLPIRNLVRTNLIRVPKGLDKNFFNTRLHANNLEMISFIGRLKLDTVQTKLRMKNNNNFSKLKRSNLILRSWSNLN
jgi:hypothetical protein